MQVCFSLNLNWSAHLKKKVFGSQIIGRWAKLGFFALYNHQLSQTCQRGPFWIGKFCFDLYMLFCGISCDLHTEAKFCMWKKGFITDSLSWRDCGHFKAALSSLWQFFVYHAASCLSYLIPPPSFLIYSLQWPSLSHFRYRIPENNMWNDQHFFF